MSRSENCAGPRPKHRRQMQLREEGEALRECLEACDLEGILLGLMHTMSASTEMW